MVTVEDKYNSPETVPATLQGSVGFVNQVMRERVAGWN